MQQYRDIVIDAVGRPSGGAPVLILNSDGSKAMIFSDNGITPAANPTTANVFGIFTFFIANGTYKAVSGVWSQPVYAFDPSELAASGGASNVGFSLAMSNEQPMTVQDYVRGEVINGLKFLTAAERASVLARDGLVNVTASVAKASASCAGNTLYWPPGRYVMDTFTYTAGLRVVGVPGSSIFERSQTVAIDQDFWITDSSLAPVRSVQNFEVYGVVFDGGSRTPQRWLQAGPSGATITDPQADYYDAINYPNGKIGNPAFPSWTIADTVAANRRNANYTKVATLLRLNLVDGGDIRMCLFRNHKGRGINEQGGRNVVVEQCGFDGIGKNDGPYHAIYTQSFGTPGAGQAFYSPSVNIQIRNNWGQNLERSFCAFMPTGGGVLEGNYIDGWGESCIYVANTVNFDGGRSVIRANSMKNGVVTDIVCWGVEAGSTNNLKIDDNRIESAQQGALTIVGGTNIRARQNTVVNCCSAFTYPYGPFSERYAFGVGTSPVAGQAVAITSLHTVNIGSEGSTGGGNNFVRETDFIETRTLGSYPYAVGQSKTGTNNIAGSCVIEGGSFQVPAGMAAQFLDTSVGQVWAANMPFTIRNVVGHASEAPVIISRVWASGSTTLVTIRAGFRPRMVHVYVSENGVPDSGQFMVGAFSWNAAAVRDDFALSHVGINGTGNRDEINASDVIRLKDVSGTTLFLAEFVNWVEDGVVFQPITANVDINTRFVCVP